MRYTEGFTGKAILAMKEAIHAAEEFGHTYIGSEHLLLGLMEEGGNAAASALAAQQLNTERLRNGIVDLVGRGIPAQVQEDCLTPSLVAILEDAKERARDAGCCLAGTEHLLLAIIHAPCSSAVTILKKLGVSLNQLCTLCSSDTAYGVRMERNRMDTLSRKNCPALFQYGKLMTDPSNPYRYDPLIGREKELQQMIRILSRRTKNNPCLIGEPGVGKTAIAEGIAQKIASGDVAFRLLDKELYLLDMTALVAGTQFRGQFEQRVKGLISEVKAAGNIILFIDEIHSIVGAGDSDGSMNAANIMKPALSRGQMQVIGATTFAEYRKYIEKDSALERRFQPVKVEEPSLLDTIEVIKGIRVYYEKHHCVRVSDPIVTSIVKLSERYITDRFLPDKAIDLLDESCACCNLRHPEITELMETQRTVADLETREHELENPEPQNGQDAAIDYEALAAVKTDLAKQREKLPALQLKVAEIEVTMDDVAQVIELWTGVPAVKIKETEYGRLQGLEDALKAHIIGQDEAVHAVAGAIKRARADLSGRHRPASFIFVGPTGVGKTELVKQLASQLFDTVDPLISIDMSEYMEKYAVSRLIGSPPGYVGYDEAGQLTEKVRRHPYSVVLFDEIEKAHPDVMNILLQILDEGKINDAQGRTVDFSNTVICMTSNAGSTDQSGATGFGKKAEVASADRSMKALQEFLRPEFIGRVDEIITFKPLSEEDLEKIAALMLDEYKPGLAAHGITLHYTQPALADIVAESSTKYGARELRRTIRKTIEDPVSDALVDGRLDGREVTLELADHDGRAVLEI